VTPHRGYDSRPENPKLDAENYRDRVTVVTHDAASERWHAHRAHGSMYRQAMPFIHEEHAGLYFIAFSRFLSEFDTSLDRMAGKYQPDGSTDNIFQITKAVTGNYFYVPSLSELRDLPKSPEIPELERTVSKIENVDSGEDLVIIYAEYCTNCGYRTIYEEKKKIIETVLAPRKVKIIENRNTPRLASFELILPDKQILWSKLAQKDGMNNYPHCFPTNKYLAEKLQEYLNLENVENVEIESGPTVWGKSHGWEDKVEQIKS